MGKAVFLIRRLLPALGPSARMVFSMILQCGIDPAKLPDSRRLLFRPRDALDSRREDIWLVDIQSGESHEYLSLPHVDEAPMRGATVTVTD